MQRWYTQQAAEFADASDSGPGEVRFPIGNNKNTLYHLFNIQNQTYPEKV